MTTLATRSAGMGSDELERQRRAVLAEVAELLGALAVDAEQARLLTLALPLLDRLAPARAFSAGVHLPLWCHAAAGGDEPAGRRLAAATGVLALAWALLDGEDAGGWRHEPAFAAPLTGLTLAGAAVPLALSRLPVAPARIVALQRILAERLVRVAAGEQRWQRLAGRDDVAVDQVLEALLQRTGERQALPALLAAALAGASPARQQAYERMARHYGVARRLRADLRALWSAPIDRPLATGACSWPLAWGLGQRSGRARARLLDLLARARGGSTEALAELRARYRDMGTHLRTLLEVARQRRRAMEALDEAEAREPAAARLRAMIAAVAE